MKPVLQAFRTRFIGEDSSSLVKAIALCRSSPFLPVGILHQKLGFGCGLRACGNLPQKLMTARDRLQNETNYS